MQRLGTMLTMLCAAGEAVYPEERERIQGQGFKRTTRLAKAASRRSRPLSLAYSSTMVACYLLLCHHSLNFTA